MKAPIEGLPSIKVITWPVWRDERDHAYSIPDILGAFAMWAVRQSPILVPGNLGEILDKLSTRMMKSGLFDPEKFYYADLNVGTLETILLAWFSEVSGIIEWNDPESWPVDDFIDLGALARNISHTLLAEKLLEEDEKSYDIYIEKWGKGPGDIRDRSQIENYFAATGCGEERTDGKNRNLSKTGGESMSGAETEGGTMRQPEVNQVLEEAANVIVRVNDLVIELNSRIAAILNSPEEKIQKEPHPPEPVRYSTPLACSIDATIVDMGRKVISTLRDTLTRLEI